ncbi:hypothetical protein QAD02_022858 [Eretmocerus hayati]|uniref:Uncharacterized protein n=1 Tax=Eretmocerus hayati TaxID=131215 RepID=A0ACC2PWP3_9HYME|nr:hypothetical protein QAD02_022858 [Eretmocerus hayati]
MLITSHLFLLARQRIPTASKSTPVFAEPSFIDLYGAHVKSLPHATGVWQDHSSQIQRPSYSFHKPQPTLDQFQCEKCSALFRYNTTLKQHLKDCCGKPPLKCENCEFFTHSNIKLRQHVLEYHSKKIDVTIPNEKRIHNCPTCTITFSKRKYLVRHLKFRCGKWPSFECTYCKTRFYYNNDLQQHINKAHGAFNEDSLSRTIRQAKQALSEKLQQDGRL